MRKKGAIKNPAYLQSANSASTLQPREVSFASGCAMLIRRQVLEQVGGFDPRFFMYVEDLELCLRIMQAGWKIRYVPDAIVKHKVQGSYRKKGEKFYPIQHPRNANLEFFVYHLTKNRLLTMDKYAKGWKSIQFWCYFPLFWTANCLRYARYGRWKAISAIMRGVYDFIVTRRVPFKNELE